MAGGSYRSLRMFGELCGDQALKKVVLVTTVWDKVVGPGIGEERERALSEGHWKEMIQRGASVARFHNTTASAWRIIDGILRQDQSEVLLLQEELVDLNKRLNETKAGKLLYAHMQKYLIEQQETLRLLARHVHTEGNPKVIAQLDSEMKVVRRNFDKALMEIKKLKIPIGRRISLFFARKSRAVSFFLCCLLFVLYSRLGLNSVLCAFEIF